jgi:hypothetical protein
LEAVIHQLESQVTCSKLLFAASDGDEDMDKPLEPRPGHKAHLTEPLEEMPLFGVSQGGSTAPNHAGARNGTRLRIDTDFGRDDSVHARLHEQEITDLQKKLKAANERGDMVRSVFGEENALTIGSSLGIRSNCLNTRSRTKKIKL